MRGSGCARVRASDSGVSGAVSLESSVIVSLNHSLGCTDFFKKVLDEYAPSIGAGYVSIAPPGFLVKCLVDAARSVPFMQEVDCTKYGVLVFFCCVSLLVDFFHQLGVFFHVSFSSAWLGVGEKDGPSG